MNDSPLTVLLHCTNLPGTVFAERQHLRLGVQKEKEVIEDVPADCAEVTFTLSLRAIRKAEWDFAGPFVHGKLGGPFSLSLLGRTTRRALGWLWPRQDQAVGSRFPSH